MKQLLLAALATVAFGCAGTQHTGGAEWNAVTEAPREAFEACVRHAPGESCTVKFDDVEASGNCAPPPSSIRDRRLICTT